MPTSKYAPPSKKRASRSRQVSLPRECCLATLASPPMRLISSRRRSSSLTISRMFMRPPEASMTARLTGDVSWLVFFAPLRWSARGVGLLAGDFRQNRKQLLALFFVEPQDRFAQGIPGRDVDLARHPLAAIGQTNHPHAPVVVGVLALDQPVALHAIDDAGDGRVI